MKTKNRMIRITLNVPEKLHTDLQNSELRHNCNSDGEAYRACVRKAIETENIPENNSTFHGRKGA